MSQKLIAMIAVEGDQDRVVTTILEKALAEKKIPDADCIKILWVDLPSEGDRCLVSVQGGEVKHIADHLDVMVKQDVLLEHVTVLCVHADIEDEKPTGTQSLVDPEKTPARITNPSTPGFVYPPVNWPTIPSASA